METSSKENAAINYQRFIKESKARKEKINRIALEIYDLIKGNQITYQDFLEINTLVHGLVKSRATV